MVRPPDGWKNPSYPPPGSVIPKGLKAVHVLWLDSASKYGWHPEDVNAPTLIHSVGIEVARTDKAITLSTSFNGGALFVDQIIIPMVAVKKITRLL